MKRNCIQVLSFIAINIFLQTASFAQSKPLVIDKEKIFSVAESKRLDSMLQQYRKLTGKIILICSDTADVSQAKFTDNLANKYAEGIKPKPYIFMLLLSQKRQHVLVSVNDRIIAAVGQRSLLYILDAGIVSFRENKNEQGATQICRKAMEFLNSLPPNK